MIGALGDGVTVKVDVGVGEGSGEAVGVAVGIGRQWSGQPVGDGISEGCGVGEAPGAPQLAASSTKTNNAGRVRCIPGSWACVHRRASAEHRELEPRWPHEERTAHIIDTRDARAASIPAFPCGDVPRKRRFGSPPLRELPDLDAAHASAVVAASARQVSLLIDARRRARYEGGGLGGPVGGGVGGWLGGAVGGSVGGGVGWLVGGGVGLRVGVSVGSRLGDSLGDGLNDLLGDGDAPGMQLSVGGERRAPDLPYGV